MWIWIGKTPEQRNPVTICSSTQHIPVPYRYGNRYRTEQRHRITGAVNEADPA